MSSALLPKTKNLALFLFRSSRPLLWPAVLLPFMGGLVLSHAPLAPGALVLMLCMSWPYNYFVYTVNDYFDVETDLLNPRKTDTGVFAGLRPSQLLASTTQPVLCGVFLIMSAAVYTLTAATTFTLFLSLLLAALLYSAPPARIKEKPPLDSLLNGFLYFGFPFLIGWSLSGSLQGVPWIKYWCVVSSAAGCHVLATVIDYTADVQAGVRTVATALGKRWALVCALVLLLPGYLATLSYPAVQVFLGITYACVLIVLCKPSELLGRTLGYYVVYPGFVIAAFLSILQVLGKF